jgi:MYXO-CTERM domain-containing protein
MWAVMSSEQPKEEIMKRLAIIALAVAGFAMTAMVAQAAGKPTGMSQQEYRALMLRSEGLNQKYGLNVLVKGENYYARGLPAASPVADVPVKGENYFARGLPTSTPTTFASAPSTSTDFQWADAGIGAGALLGLMALAAAALGLRRHRFHLRTS